MIIITVFVPGLSLDHKVRVGDSGKMEGGKLTILPRSVHIANMLKETTREFRRFMGDLAKALDETIVYVVPTQPGPVVRIAIEIELWERLSTSGDRLAAKIASRKN